MIRRLLHLLRHLWASLKGDARCMVCYARLWRPHWDRFTREYHHSAACDGACSAQLFVESSPSDGGDEAWERAYAKAQETEQGCPQVGTGGHHSEGYYEGDGTPCAWCAKAGIQM